jgi:hypothetical protein
MRIKVSILGSDDRANYFAAYYTVPRVGEIVTLPPTGKPMRVVDVVHHLLDIDANVPPPLVIVAPIDPDTCNTPALDSSHD